MAGFHALVSQLIADPRWDLDRVLRCEQALGGAPPPLDPDLRDEFEELVAAAIAKVDPLDEASRQLGGCDQVERRPDLLYTAAMVRVEWLALRDRASQAACAATWFATFQILATLGVHLVDPVDYPDNVKSLPPNGFNPRHELQILELPRHERIARWQALIDDGTELNQLATLAQPLLDSDRVPMHFFHVANLTRISLLLNHRRTSA